MKKLLMFAASGLLTPALASADATFTTFAPAPTLDKAPVSGTPNARLRRTDEEQPGHEMPVTAMFDDGKSGLVFAMSTELKGVGATHRMQLSLTPFALAQNTAGAVEARADITAAKFVTANDGNEYRNANHPDAYPILGGKLIAVEYNYQPNNTNNTERYMMVFDKTGKAVMAQTKIFAKNNDDCSMNQDAQSTATRSISGTSERLVGWRGCNGNGSDDGWVSIHDVTCAADLSSCTVAKVADLSVCPREERSHGTVSFGTDPNTVIATWTEGNTQPQRDGTWMAAINVGQGATGANAQSRLLWKKQLDGRKDLDGVRTYSMRAKSNRITQVDPATGKTAATDMLFVQTNDLAGNNNTNNGKGGRNIRLQLSVIEATATGMKYVTPMTDLAQDQLLGMDGTHNGTNFGMFGATNAMVPGIAVLNGNHTGGGAGAQVRTITWDKTAGKFADSGMYTIAPYDRHLYPNYLGNNPGNQGRNYANSIFIANPYVGMNGNTDAHLMLFATTGKSIADMTKPEIKLTGFLSVVPVTSTPVTPPTGSDPTNPTNPDPTNPTNPDPAGTDSGSALGGCSATTGSSGALTFLLIGLAAFIRRRRS